MSRAWNGESLVDELSALLGDTSATFKTRVLGWLNDTIFDISSRHDWGHHLTKGKKILAASEEVHSLEVEAPGAALVELDNDGSLAAASVYSILVTYAQGNGVETLAGDPSEELTATDSQKTILISEIPTSDETLVTKRRIYLKKDDGNYYLHGEIDDNFTTDYAIDSDTDSAVQPPDYESIRRLNGGPFFESGPSTYLEFKDADQLRRLAQGEWGVGSPQYFAPIEANSIYTYPKPSSDMELSFNYFRYPARLYNDSDSSPDLPIYLKPALKAGVIALGYEYRDRAGQEIKRANYENALVDAINRGGRVANVEYSVKDVYGTIDGFEVG